MGISITNHYMEDIIWTKRSSMSSWTYASFTRRRSIEFRWQSWHQLDWVEYSSECVLSKYSQELMTKTFTERTDGRARRSHPHSHRIPIRTSKWQLHKAIVSPTSTILVMDHEDHHGGIESWKKTSEIPICKHYNTYISVICRVTRRDVEFDTYKGVHDSVQVYVGDDGLLYQNYWERRRITLSVRFRWLTSALIMKLKTY